MKKRVLSMLLAFILCFSTLPMTAFAQEADAVTEQEEQQEAAPAAEPEEQQEADSAEEQKEAEAVAAPGEETSSDKSTTAGEAPDTVEPSVESVSDSDAGTQDTSADDEKKAAVQKVQALIDALPDEVTVENAESVGAQLEAIDEAMESLTKEQIAELDMGRFDAICAALNAPMTVEAGEHTHFLCGKDTCNRVGGHTETNKVTFQAWNGTSELPKVVGNYYLMNNVTLNEAWTPVDGVVLCLNGHTITVEANEPGIIVGNGKIFTLCDCMGSGKITHGTDNNGAKYDGRGVDVSQGTFNMYGGSITDNKALKDVGVKLYYGTFNMYGGNITKNETGTSQSTQQRGTDGGVSVGEHSIFNMYAGTISNNVGANGGGVGISKGTFNMSGGTIENNSATRDDYNSDSGSGGGVCIYAPNDSKFNMSGGIIKNNRANCGGGVSVGWARSFNMTGGEITGNTADKSGSGVYLLQNSHFTVSGLAKVSDNTTSNVYLPDGATMAIGQGGFDNTASIGVTTENLPTRGSYVAIATGAANGGYRNGTFINDQTTDDCEFRQVGDQILLVNGTLHQHPICGKACNHGGADTDEAWKGVSSLDDITTSGNYYLTQDIEQTQTWNLPNARVVLCLNGHNITANTDVDVIKISYNAQFILTDCMGEKTEYGKITHKEGKVGRGIYVDSIFTMYGGEISGNTIATSTSVYGGGVYVDYGSFTMHGGSITNNKTSETSGSGGGVYVSDHGSFTMDGGSIIGNRAPRSGGGVYSMGDFIVSGKAIITNNTAMDGQTANNAGLYKTIKVDAAGLDSTAQIGVTTSKIANGSYAVVAEGTDSHNLTNTDLSCFSSDAGYMPKLINNNIVFTNGAVHEHAICGEKNCEDRHDDALWIPLTYENNQLKYGGTTASSTTTTGPGYANIDKYDTITEYTLPKGNYYLADNITIDGTIKISGNVNLCLNGHTISTNSNKVSYAVIYTQYWNLSICDCTGKGSLKVPNNGVTNGIQTSADIKDKSGILYLYGGTISGGNCGVNVKGQLYLYGGTITGNSCGVSDAQKITIGGNVKITDNTCKNVELSSGKTITIDKSLTKDAKIGITTFPKPSQTTPSIQIAAGADRSLKYTDIFKSDMTDYVITQTGTDLYLGIHQHNWTYSAEGATITIKCDAENCNLGTDFAATYTVTAPTDYLTYSGSDKPATVEVSENATDLTLPEKPTVTYQKQNGNEFETLNGVPTDVGTYRASIKMGDKTASVTYKIVSKKVAYPTIEVTGTYTYDGTEKTPAVVVKDEINVIPSTEYSVSCENNINAGNATVTITDVDGGNYNVSGSTTFTIDKATITVTPENDQKTIYGSADLPLRYSCSGAVNGEKPAFAGALSRSVGKDTGKYNITLGTLALADNSAGNFRAENYELKLADTPVQFTIVPKTLSAEDLEFITDSPITKTYDGTTACDTATVRIKSRAIAYDKDDLPTVKGTYAYNSANVTEANEVIFTSEVSENQNYILPAGLELGHAANITKADQAALTITSTSATYGTDLTLTVDGGSGNGALTYTVENGTGVATISGSTLQPVRAGQVTVQATKAGDDNYNEVKSSITVITINKGTYPGIVSKTINIIKNRSGKQMGTLTAADFFPEGKAPAGTEISGLGNDTGEIVNVTRNQDLFKGYILNYITVDDNITSETDQTCKVTISSANYQNIEATLTFHPTDKTTVTIEGLTYTDKTYDGSAIQPTGTLQVTGGNVPANELEVTYTGTGNTTYNSPIAPKDAGTYEVTYKVADSNENYTGEVTYTFTISPKNVTAGMIGTIAAQEYTGSAITPEPVVKDGGVALSLGTDFDLRYDNNINAGENTATVTINGKGNYTGTASRTFTISPKDIQGAVITLQADSLVYTGLTQEVQITSVTLNQVPLTANDYDIVKGSNKRINADDSITLTIAGKGNYTGTATTTWKITKAAPKLGNFDVTPELSQKQTYDGKPKEVTAKTKNGVIDMGDVTVYYEGTSGTTYPRSETAPTNAGIYKVILSVAEGKNYTAAEIESGTLTIEKADLTVEDVTEFFEYTKKGEQTINLAELVPGATNYAPGTYTDVNGILTGDLTIDATGLMKFALSALTKDNIDKKVTVPVIITSENYKDVTVEVTIYISPEYRIIDGANSSWTQNTDGTVVIRGDGEFSRFHAVKVDGKVIDPANYAAKEGSTIITLKAEYLKTLATGSHTFAIVWNNGIAGTNFTVAANTSGNNSGNNSNNNDSNHGSHNSGNNDSGNTAGTAANTAAASAQELDKVPATGDASGIWLTLFVISLTGLVGMLARRKKN